VGVEAKQVLVVDATNSTWINREVGKAGFESGWGFGHGRAVG
jgi:hypothetical protein